MDLAYFIKRKMFFSILFFVFTTTLVNALSVDNPKNSDQKDAQTDYCSVEWIFADNCFDNNGNIEGGILVKLKPGWHSYGPEPGDFGMPPRIEFSETDELEISPPKFPKAKEFREAAGKSFGYSDSFLIIFSMKKKKPSPQKNIEAKIEILLCKDVCMPVNKKIEIRLPCSEQDKTAISAKWKEAMELGGWNTN
ncbi:MAG TPA: protein-disulfide reductase DsbD family protein [Victivallales bacterium]|nr:protein-disulfide reductase DsbD family protein [Victivallales bacterium]